LIIVEDEANGNIETKKPCLDDTGKITVNVLTWENLDLIDH